MANFHTTGTLARDNGVPIHCIEYIIRSRGVKPVARVSNANVYDDEAAARIAVGLAEAAASNRRKGAGHGC